MLWTLSGYVSVDGFISGLVRIFEGKMLAYVAYHDPKTGLRKGPAIKTNVNGEILYIQENVGVESVLLLRIETEITKCDRNGMISFINTATV